MKENYSNINISDETPFDFKKWLFKILKIWPYFLGSLIISFLIAYFYNSIVTPKYNVKTTLLVKKNFIVDKDFVDLNLPTGYKGLENEMGILKSYSMAQSTIMQLDFGVSYFIEKKFKDKEIYNRRPFTVKIDSAHNQIINTNFIVSILNKDEFKIETDLENAMIINPISQELILSMKPSFLVRKHRFGDVIKTDYSSFKIIKERPDINSGKVLFKLNPIENIANLYSTSIEVKPSTKTSTILLLSMDAELPEKGAKYLNKLVENYINIGLEEKNKTAKNAISFINNQLYGIADSLYFVENKLQKFRTENQIFDLSAEGNAVFSSLTNLTNQKSLEELKLKYYKYLLDYITKERSFQDIVAPSVMGISDPLLNDLVINLSNLYSELNTLRLSAKEKNPAYAELQSKIKLATGSLEENLHNIINSEKIVTEDLNVRINRDEKKIGKLPNTERQLVNIKRRFSLNENLYTYLLQKRAEAGISKASNIPDNQVIDIAKQAIKIYPKKTTNYVIALIVGLLLPLSLLLLVDYFNEKIQDRNDLEKTTNISVIGEIFHNNTKSSLVTNSHPKSAIAESFRSLRSTILFLLKAKKECKIIIVTSSKMGEGKSFCSSNLAHTLSATGRKTLLIEVDFRRPKVNNNLSNPIHLGLTDFLGGDIEKESIIQKMPWENLDLISGGSYITNPLEVFVNRKLSKLFLELKDKYEYIILDAAPVGLVTDAIELSCFADLTIYIVRHKYTKFENLRRIQELQQMESLKNLYIVYNDLNKTFSGDYFEEEKASSFFKRHVKLIS